MGTTSMSSSLRAAPSSVSLSYFNLPRLSHLLSSISFSRRAKSRTNMILSLSNCWNSCLSNDPLSTSSLPYPPPFTLPVSGSCSVVSLRLKALVTEFQSLVEPLDRVKRLLDYATVLPRLGDSIRSPENRVAGCAAQVWLEVEVNEFGRMRFGADSDSEITKGFCSCLIYLLDGASPEEVLKVRAEDLTDMNVGLPVRSRVNSWNNVLIGMQERTTTSLMVKKEVVVPPLDPLPSLVISPESVVAKGSDFIAWTT